VVGWWRPRSAVVAALAVGTMKTMCGVAICEVKPMLCCCPLRFI
jgi:hypothetical protein